jgi:hypothetical protein
MKALLISLFALSFMTTSLLAQNPMKVSVKNGNVFVHYSNVDIKQITFGGTDSEASLSHNKAFVIFLRTIKNPQKSSTADSSVTESSIILHDLLSSQEKEMVKSSKPDGKGGSSITYANSTKYPFPGLANVMNPMLSPDDHRIYFETTAWTTSHATHFIHIPTKNIYFFHAGSFTKVNQDGSLIMNISATRKNGGRYYQDLLINKNGDEVKAAGNKE